MASGKFTHLDLDRVKKDLFIGGAWRPGAGEARIDVVDPSRGEAVATIADARPEDAEAAVAAAYDAGPGWAATAPRQRSEILRACFAAMLAQKEMLAELVSLENGKTLADARAEIVYSAEFFRWFAEEAVRLNGELAIAPGGANRMLVQYHPIGVSVLITPWNFPAAMAARKIAPALAAGCTVVLKPATETPLTAFAIAEICAEAGVPAGVVNVLTTSQAGKVVGTMLRDPRVRKLSFTGSTEVGRTLLREAAENVLSCSMELGGNAPFIVFEDADLDAALDGAMIAKMRNGGEACTAANRFFVHKCVLDRFGRGLAERMDALALGPGYDEASQCGPMINAGAAERIAGLVEDALAAGAERLTARDDAPEAGFYVPPAVLSGVTPQMTVAREEIFGPVAALIPFETEDEAVRLANDTEFGLVAYVYTGDLAKGLRVSERLECGMVGLNRGLVSDPAAPFGGVKQSGLGREGGHHGILEFCEPKYIAADW